MAPLNWGAFYFNMTTTTPDTFNSNPAWQVTDDDVETILRAHKCGALVSEAMEKLNIPSIVNGLLHYVEFEDQVNSMMADIEQQLLACKFITGDALWSKPTPPN